MPEAGDKVSKVAMALCGVEEGSKDAALLAGAYVPVARAAILALRNPFSKDPYGEAWEPRYDMLLCEWVAELWARRGGEGEVSHSENGISRTWAASNVSPSLVRRVVPRGRAV